MSTKLYLPSYPSMGEGGLQPAFRQKPGRNNKIVPQSFFNMPKDGPFVGSGAFINSGEFFGAGNVTGPRDDVPEQGYGGPTNVITMSFWVRFNENLEFPDRAVPIAGASRHNSTDPYFMLSVRRSASTPGIIIQYSKQSPYLNSDGGTFAATLFPDFMDSSGNIVTNKWFWLSAHFGSPNRVMVRTEGGSQNYTGSIRPSQHCHAPVETYSWKMEIGSNVKSSSSGPYYKDVGVFDLCNLRVGYQQLYPQAWWDGQFWQKQIDISAERAACVEGGMSEDNAKRCLTYGYPFQTALGGAAEQTGVGFTPNMYTGSIIAGIGPTLYI